MATGRSIIVFDDASEAVCDLHALAGIARADGEAALSRHLGAGVLVLPDDARDRLATRMRVRPERYLEVPDFHPRRLPTEEAAIANWALPAIGVGDGSYTGAGVKLCILDSGLFGDHADLRGRIAADHTRVFAGPSIADTLGHGTMCAGIVAGPKAPAAGPRYGVAPDVELFVGRILDAHDRAAEGDIIAGIDWAIDKGCKIVSLSVGARPDAAPDPDYDRIAAKARHAGTLIVAAAGNDSRRPDVLAPVRMPANSALILAVAAVGGQGLPTSESNEGLHANGGLVDIAAPGANVYSASNDPEAPYMLYDGTSVATPFVAALAAHWLEREPTLTAAALWTRICDNAQRALAAHRSSVGAGMIRAPARPT